jgi:hypothetical protein
VVLLGVEGEDLGFEALGAGGFGEEFPLAEKAQR